MYSAVTPVLPHYAHMLHASKPAIGLLAAAYPAGMCPARCSAPGWPPAPACAGRRVIGLLMFTVSIVAFGFATDIVTLDALRFVQGVACGFIWGGGLAWVIAVAPRERRGEVLGTVIAAAIFGTLLGPVAGHPGGGDRDRGRVHRRRRRVGGARRLDAAAIPSRRAPPSSEHPMARRARWSRNRADAARVLADPARGGHARRYRHAAAVAPVAVRRLGRRRSALTFLLAVADQHACLARPIGRVVDRRGARLPLVLGLTVTAVLLAVLPLPHSALGLAILGVIALGGPLTAYTIPAMSMITDGSERAGVPVVFATMMLNLAWATGRDDRRPGRRQHLAGHQRRGARC